MAYFPDLAPYGYGHRAHPGVVHVGWLDAEHEYPKGTVRQSIIEKLKAMAAHPVELYRGFHLCEMCQPPPEARLEPIPNRVVSQPNSAWTEWAKPRMSNGEIRVKRDGLTFAAPVCIAHYIEAHGYLPPTEFLVAVEESPNPPSVPVTAAP